MKKLIIILSATVLLTSCEKREPKTKEKLGDYDLELLFEKDGCKVYRFFDGEYIYWADCSGKIGYKQKASAGKTQISHKIDSFTTVLK